MKKILLLLPFLLLSGCKPSDQAGGDGVEAIMQGKPVSYWIDQLKNPDPEKKLEAGRILKQGGIKDPTVRQELIQTLKGNDSELRVAVCEVLGCMGWYATDALDALKGLLNDKDEKVRYTAGIAMGWIDLDEAAKVGIPRSVVNQQKKPKY